MNNMKLYAAYGSNLNKKQMLRRCPASKPFSKLVLNDWELCFKGVADIVVKEGSNVHIGLYLISPDCEKALDYYEDFPFLYNKQFITKNVKGTTKEIMLYVMNKKYKIGAPNISYFNAILQGYMDWSFNYPSLLNALKHSVYNNSKDHYESKNWNKSQKITMVDLEKIISRLSLK